MAAIAAVMGLAAGISLASSRRAHHNSVRFVVPYQFHDNWVFDDASTGLVHEPFVKGIPQMIDLLVAGIPNAKDGFRLYFSDEPFLGYQRKLTWVRESAGGNYYRLDDPPLEGWLCPALFRYYRLVPKVLYVKAESKEPGDEIELHAATNTLQ